MSALEWSIALGVPVVATEFGGGLEYMDPSNTLLVAPRSVENGRAVIDVPGMAHAMRLVRERQTRGERAVPEEFWQKFSIESTRDSLLRAWGIQPRRSSRNIESTAFIATKTKGSLMATKKKKKYTFSYTFEILVEAPNDEIAEQKAQDLVDYLQATYHRSGHNAVKEAGFSLVDYVEGESAKGFWPV